MTTTRKARTHNGPKPEEILCADLVALMESSDLPAWRRDWSGARGAHRNMISGHEYSGSNPLLLEMGCQLRGLDLPLWLGAAEAKQRGWWPRKGSKAVRILRPQLNKREETDEHGQPVTGPDGTPTISAWVSYKPVAVFNAADLVGHDEETQASLAAAIAAALQLEGAQPASDGERIAAAEKVLAAWPVETTWAGTRAMYSPLWDRIAMPSREAFHTAEGRLATWAHEQAHSTGHKDRLNRDLAGRQGSDAYAREELVAELAAVLICYRLQIGCRLENHAAYLRSWADMLREGGPRMLFKVLSDARKAADLIAPESTAGEG